MSGLALIAADRQADSGSYWAEYRIGFADRTALARMASGPLPPLLDELRRNGSLHLAFLQRKEPGIRLRIHWATRLVDDPILGLLQVLSLATPQVFQPPVSLIPYRESALFGGEAALDLVEGFFDADSRMVLSLAAGHVGKIDPLAVSMDLLDTLFRTAAMDRWEVWSMWQNLAALRGGPSPAPISPRTVPHSWPVLEEARMAAIDCAAGLRGLAERGQLSAPLRAVLPVVAAFHLNRMGFDARSQAALATGAALALSPYPSGPDRLPVLAPIAFERVALGPASVFAQPKLTACIAERDAKAWRKLASVAELELLREAVEGPMRAALSCRSSRPLEDAPNVLERPPDALRKHDRRTIDTVLNLVWRHCANPVPFADLAVTRIFDPRHPTHPADVRRTSAPSADDPFAADRFDARRATRLPTGLDAALEVAAAAFSRADAPCPSPAQIALAALLDEIGHGQPLRLCDADLKLTALYDRLGLSPANRDPLVLAHALGLSGGSWPDLPEALGEAVPDFLAPPVLAGGAADAPRRVALRLQTVAEVTRLVFLGADRMCWLARYLPRGHRMEPRLRHAAADWLSRWPETVDATAGFTSHPLDDHAPLTLHGARLSPERHWLQRRANGLYDLTDGDGRTLHAVHFGVSATAALQPVARLALAAGARLPSWGEWVLGALNQRILMQLRQAGDAPLALPGVTLGGHLLLPGSACVLPVGCPALRLAEDGDPVALWNLLDATGGATCLGPVTVKRLPGPETRILDLRLRSGMRTLARMAARPGASWLMIDPIPLHADGTPACEHYIELADDCARRHLQGSPPWTSP
jgi:thiopeptide-type bacteriocin biosynthesis protein